MKNCVLDIEIDQIKVADEATHHTYRSKPLYSNRFLFVQKFHPPGLAPVQSISGSYHIDVAGNAIYSMRYTQCFGFYYERAAVAQEQQWFHILPNGKPLYNETYAWCGNYQDAACVVRDFNGMYSHINLSGLPLYKKRFCYAGDFRDGIAVIQNNEGLYTHIDKNGNAVHNKWFQDLDVFHKGYARAKDKVGWFHIDKKGMPIYEERFLLVEDFYNGQARVEKETGEIRVILPTAETVRVVREVQNSEFQLLSADLVGYWKTQTIKAAVDLELFDCLPATTQALAEKIGITENKLKRLLRALTEINLVCLKNDRYCLTQKSVYLNSKHPFSLVDAAKHWGGSHYHAWSHLTAALKGDGTLYADLYQKPLFEWLDQNQERVAEYQHAMQSYAKHDYEKLSRKLDLKRYNTVIDAAGGTGSLLFYVLKENPYLKGELFERASVVNLVNIPSEISKRVKLKSFDLFKKWPGKAGVVLLSRVLHDWDDRSAINILKNASNAIILGGRLILIEFLLDQNDSSGGMLDLNMMVITGARERTLEEYISLAKETNLCFQKKVVAGSYHAIEFSV